jgi:tryptophan-rich sensory protein
MRFSRNQIIGALILLAIVWLVLMALTFRSSRLISAQTAANHNSQLLTFLYLRLTRLNTRASILSSVQTETFSEAYT